MLGVAGHLATTKSIGQELHGRLCAVTKASRPGDRHVLCRHGIVADEFQHSFSRAQTVTVLVCKSLNFSVSAATFLEKCCSVQLVVYPRFEFSKVCLLEGDPRLHRIRFCPCNQHTACRHRYTRELLGLRHACEATYAHMVFRSWSMWVGIQRKLACANTHKNPTNHPVCKSVTMEVNFLPN